MIRAPLWTIRPTVRAPPGLLWSSVRPPSVRPPERAGGGGSASPLLPPIRAYRFTFRTMWSRHCNRSPHPTNRFTCTSKPDQHVNRFEPPDVHADAALLRYNLAPLATRRDVSMLGLIHRIVLRLAPPEYDQYIKPASDVSFQRGWAFSAVRHNKQLQDPIDGTHINIMERSVLGLIHTYNCLPQSVVNMKHVNSFQRKLQQALKNAAKGGLEQWEYVFRRGFRRMSSYSFHKLFERSGASS